MNNRHFQKVLIVDNNQEELDQLYEILNKIGFQTDTHLYDQSMSVSNLYSGYRVFFFDLNITPISIDPSVAEDLDWNTNSKLREVFGHLAQALIDIISTENGPYALILWTKHHELIDSFKDYILKRHSKSSFPHPFFISYLDKMLFNSDDTIYS